MWYPYRTANCGSSVDLTQVDSKSQAWASGKEDEEEVKRQERINKDNREEDTVPEMTTLHTISGPCTGNCYPDATQVFPSAYQYGYPYPYDPHGYWQYPGGYPSGYCHANVQGHACCTGYHSQMSSSGMVGLQRSSSCGIVPTQLGSCCCNQPCQQTTLHESENDSENTGNKYRKKLLDPWDYSPDTTDQKDLSPHTATEVDESEVNLKFSLASLRPDSSLPPVIRRRNRNRRKLIAQSMIDGASWDTSGRPRSQSISDEQWSQLLAAQGHHAPPPPPPPHQVNDTTSNRFSSAGAASVRGVAPGRGGMMSSTSVCNLNTLAQPYQQPLSLQQQQLMPLMGGMHQSGSFQQLNMVPYNGGMMWSPPPCDMCHVPPMYPPPLPSHGMKRAASNISMNMSSASSDVTGYPWQQHMHQPHMHHPMYPGYYPPPPPPPHILPTSMQGSSISIPDSMAAFNKVSSSPAPSVRSSSRRSHRSNKSRSFSTADLSRRTRSTHRSDSDESTSSSPSMEEEVHSSRPSYPGGPLAWQCDHCTFINQAGSRVCGMCSKTQGSSSHSKAIRKNSERRRSERRYISRRNDRDDDDREPSDYDNDGKHNSTQYNNTRDNRRDKSSKSSISSRSKKKLRRRGGSSGSASDVVDDLERQLSDLKVSKSRGPEYDGGSSKLREREKDRDRERGSRRREGKQLRRD